MEVFEGTSLERSIMEKVGCVDYCITAWESVKPDVYQRQVHYNFAKCVSRYGGEVTSTQQKSLLPDRNGYIVEEVMTLQGVPLSDDFNVRTSFSNKYFRCGYKCL